MLHLLASLLEHPIVLCAGIAVGALGHASLQPMLASLLAKLKGKL